MRWSALMVAALAPIAVNAQVRLDSRAHMRFLSDDLLEGRWLKHFQFGPLEWLWRTLTYMRLQPMRRPPTGALAAGS